MAQLLKGKPVADAMTVRLSQRASMLVARGVTPTLAIVRVGARDDDLAYERGAQKRCAACGIAVQTYPLPATCTQAELLTTLEHINGDEHIHGCLMFRPLPTSLDETAACSVLSPAKDVDGMTEGSLFGVFAQVAQGFPPCTADAVMQLLNFYGLQLEGANVVVIGRSLVIGKPISMMLQAAHATVTMCHTKTRDLAAACASADIVVVAAGHAKTFTAACARPQQCIIDVGINWDEETERLVGDVEYDAVEPVVKALTPVPGGVGAVTTACLAEHVIQAAERWMN